MAKAKKGRASIFRGKVNGIRVQGVITKAAGKWFENRRLELAKLANVTLDKVSDADVIEYLARGVDNTREYLEA